MSLLGQSGQTQFTLKPFNDRKPLKAHMVSWPQDQGACSSSSVTEEYEHAKPSKLRASRQTHALEQRQTDRRKTSVETEARLGDQDPIAARGTNT
jgi:hypothetical protein